MKGKKRDSYWDIVKGLGIIAVVLGHSGFWQYTLIINMYHMALFFFVSGYLYNNKYTGDCTLYINQKFKTLWLPLMKYTVLAIAVHNVFININIYSMITGQTMIYPKEKYTLFIMIDWVIRAILTGSHNEEIIGAVWFIYPMLLSMIGYCYIRSLITCIKVSTKKQEIIIYVFCWIMSGIGMALCMNQLKFTWRVDISLLCMAIVGSGYLYKKYGSRNSINILGVIVLLPILFYFNNKGLNISFAGGTIGNPIWFVMATFSGIYVNLYLAKLILQFLPKMGIIIACLGENSFHIMALHFLGMKLVNIIDIVINNKQLYNLAMFPYSNSEWWVLNTLAGLFVPILIVFSYKLVISRIKRIKHTSFVKVRV